MAGQFNWGAMSESVNQAIGTITEYEKRKKVNAKIESAIKTAREAGLSVKFKIDPATGDMAAPEISSKEKGPYEDIMREMLQKQGQGGGQGQGGYEVSGLGPQGPRLSKIQPKYDPQELAVGKTILKYGSQAGIPMTIKGMQVMLDPNTPEGIEKAMDLVYDKGWQQDPELQAAGFPQLYEQRIQELTAKTEKIQAETEPKIQPFTTSGDLPGRSVGGKAYYKEAAAKYGDDKAAKIVDIAVKLQKQGMPIAKIEALMKEQGIDPALILGAYKKK